MLIFKLSKTRTIVQNFENYGVKKTLRFFMTIFYTEVYKNKNKDQKMYEK